jgi:hypothetical protein
MKLSLRVVSCMLAIVGVVMCWPAPRSESSQGVNFDKLSAQDRKVLQERFGKEIWPLMQRGGKDGCVGCHSTSKGGQALRLSGDLGKDFPRLVKDGFFIPDDLGSLLGRMLEKDPKRRMPPDKRPGWSDKELDLLRVFVADLDKKQKK